MPAAKHDTKRSETQLVGEVRIAFPFHHEKRTKMASGAPLKTPRYDSQILFPKLGPAETCPNYAKLSALAMEAALKAWPTGWPAGGKWPVLDGDIPHAYKPKPGDTPLTEAQIIERNKWRTGHWCFEVANNLPTGPKVSLLNNGVMQDIPAKTMNGTDLYKSGDYGYVSMSAYTYHSEDGSKWGVNFSYEGVAYTRQGELIGGGPKSSAQMFAGIPVGAGAGMVSGGVSDMTRPPAPAAPGLPPLPPLSSSPPLAPAAPPMPPGVAAGAPPLPIPGR